MRKILLTVAALLMILPGGTALTQETPPVVAIDESKCGRFSALVTDAEPGDTIRFQLGHDMVKTVEVSEQDTPTRFDSGPFPAGDWGFSAAVNGKNLSDQIVTVKDCAKSRTLEVTEFDCNTVSVLGNGWAQTEATVEVAIPPSEGGESREDLVMIKQVQPSSEGVFHTTLDWPETPRPGRYAAVVLIDNIQQDPQSAGFEIKDCTADQLPFTGINTVGALALAVALMGTGIVLVLIIRRPRR